MLQRERVAQNMAIARQNRRCPQQARLSSSGGGGLCGNSLQDLCGPVHFRRQRRSALNIALVTCAHARLRNAEFCCSLLWPLVLRNPNTSQSQHQFRELPRNEFPKFDLRCLLVMLERRQQEAVQVTEGHVAVKETVCEFLRRHL